MKKLLTVLVFGGTLLMSCQKDHIEIPGDPDLGPSIAKKMKSTDIYTNSVDQVVYNSCTEEFIWLRGEIDCKYTMTISGDIIKYDYTLEFRDVEGVGELSGRTYKTEYKHRSKITLDFSPTGNGFDILKQKEKATMKYTCENGQTMLIDIKVKYKPDNQGNVRLDTEQDEYAVESCN